MGVPLGGQDTQYARGDIFPGVFRFVLELAATSERAPLPVAVLTARAREFRFALELRPDVGEELVDNLDSEADFMGGELVDNLDSGADELQLGIHDKIPSYSSSAPESGLSINYDNFFS